MNDYSQPNAYMNIFDHTSGMITDIVLMKYHTYSVGGVFCSRHFFLKCQSCLTKNTRQWLLSCRLKFITEDFYLTKKVNNIKFVFF